MACKVKELSPAEKLAIQHFINTGSASYAYGQAYPGKYSDQKDAADRMRKLLKKPDANEYQKQIRKEVEEKINISKEWLLDEIIKLKEQASSAMDYSSSVKCLFLIAKMQGYMSKQVIDVKKTISITFGGGFNPNAPQIQGETKKILLSETIGDDDARINLDSLSKIEIQDEDGIDKSKLDEY